MPLALKWVKSRWLRSSLVMQQVKNPSQIAAVARVWSMARELLYAVEKTPAQKKRQIVVADLKVKGSCKTRKILIYEW